MSGIIKNLDEYPWSSYNEYTHSGNILCSTSEILGFFSSKEKYIEFLEDQIAYGEALELIKHQLVDVED